MKIDLEEARKRFGVLSDSLKLRAPDSYKNLGDLVLALCAENKKLRELVGAQKELILALNGRSAFGWREILRERAKELRTKIAELEKKTDNTDNVLIGKDDQMGNYL